MSTQLRQQPTTPNLKSAKDIYAIGGTKCCSKCGERKPVHRDNFGSCNGGKNVRGVCRACIRANTRRHYDQHPEKLKARVEKSQRLRTTQCWSKSEQLTTLLKNQKGKCGYCGKQMSSPTVDHKIPVSRGGTDALDNLIAACKPCNSRKRDKTDQEYREFLALVE
jgi:5-methylcytosine-specific restriction protein A